jgi:hypothetical protein
MVQRRLPLQIGCKKSGDGHPPLSQRSRQTDGALKEKRRAVQGERGPRCNRCRNAEIRG